MRVILIGICLSLCSLSTQAGWEVTWIDRFDGSGVNWSNWTAQTNANYNNEVQCYTDDETSSNRNYQVSDGTLKITSRRMNINCPGQNGRFREWTSGRLNSKDKAEFLYGRIETRLRFNELRHGTWPAFWALENRIQEQPIAGDGDNVGWPNRGAGEIDIWEWHGNNGNSYITAFHNSTRYSGSDACGAVAYYNYPAGAPDVQDFQVYAMEWTADSISFHVNDTEVVRYDMRGCDFYEEPMFLLLNVAMGGTLGGSIDSTLNTSTLEVDYVARCLPTTSNQATRCNEATPVALDNDDDGVANSEDQCPATPSNTNVDYTGCTFIPPEQLPEAPESPAPTPTADPSEVISLFSDAYEDITNIDYNPNWNQATLVEQTTIAGNNTLVYRNLNYQGTDFGENKQDVSDYDFLHIDYWTRDASFLELYLISPGPQENPVTLPITRAQWQSASVPLSEYQEVVDLTDTFQLKIVGSGTVFIDNIYFSRRPDDTSPSPSEPVTPSNPSPSNNTAPTINLLVAQASQSVSRIDTTAGMVTIIAQVQDADNNDTHTLDWTITGVSNHTVNNAQLTFSPDSIDASQVTVTATATDSGSPALNASLTLTLDIFTPATTPTTSTQNNPESGGSGGTNSFWLLMGMFIISVWRKKKT
jgi:beta-glucanase (GH16 family)